MFGSQFPGYPAQKISTHIAMNLEGDITVSPSTAGKLNFGVPLDLEKRGFGILLGNRFLVWEFLIATRRWLVSPWLPLKPTKRGARPKYGSHTSHFWLGYSLVSATPQEPTVQVYKGPIFPQKSVGSGSKLVGCCFVSRLGTPG